MHFSLPSFQTIKECTDVLHLIFKLLYRIADKAGKDNINEFDINITYVTEQTG